MCVGLCCLRTKVFSSGSLNPQTPKPQTLNPKSEEHTPRGVGWGFGLNIVTTSELAGGGGGQQPKPHVRRFWFNPTLT